jgi:hypothetical protein
MNSLKKRGRKLMAKAKNNMTVLNLLPELWREYHFGCPKTKVTTIYRINNPVRLYLPKDREYTTHRVLDKDGVVHCVPAPGYHGCVLRWKNRNPKIPVNF